MIYTKINISIQIISINNKAISLGLVNYTDFGTSDWSKKFIQKLKIIWVVESHYSRLSMI